MPYLVPRWFVTAPPCVDDELGCLSRRVYSGLHGGQGLGDGRDLHRGAGSFELHGDEEGFVCLQRSRIQRHVCMRPGVF